MNFRILLLAVALMPVCSVCCLAQKNKSLPFSAVNGYRLKAGTHPGKGYIFQLYARNDDLAKSFEKNPASKNSSRINFNSSSLVACINEKSGNELFITLEKIEKKDGVMGVYFKTSAGKKLPAPVNSFGLYSVGLDKSLSGIDYYVNGKLVQELRN